MIGRYFYGALAVAILIASASITSFAQVGELRGHVWMQQTAGGEKVPLADAQIDVYRVDMSGKYNTKTNKKGEFVFAGLPFVGVYTVAASHATAQPNWVPGVKAGREIPVEITLTPGDGKRLTFEEIRAGGGGSPAPPATGGGASGGGESASDKAKREELAKKNKEIEESNKKVAEANEVISRTFKAGNDALTAGTAASKAQASEDAIQKFTLAVAQYDEGLVADPEQPAILTNKAVALKARGVERFNAAVRSKTLDDAGRSAALQSAKEDFKAAAETATKAVNLIKAQTVPTELNEVARYNANKYAAMLTNAESMRLYVSKADATQADAGLAAFKEYLAVELDPAKKSKAQLDMAQMLLDAGAADKALAEFQAILVSQPDSPEANLGAGLAVYAGGDKAKYQEAANYLQRFVQVAPDSNPMKDDAKAILTEMKNTDNVVPEKTKPAPRRRP